jgi:uncharacterized heparinase superfamily protein
MLTRMAKLNYPGSQAEQLLLAPQELRTADPSFATEFYNGHFGLAGRLAELGSQSPFEIEPPSEAWARELHGFAWLRHLRAAGSELSREQAKALVRDWVRLRRTVRGLTWQPEVVARRVISWLSNSVVVLDASDPRSYEMFLKALTEQLRYLSASYRDAPDGVPRLVALMALIYGGLCIAEQQAVVDRYVGPFAKELDRQILPDGGHISRNPLALIELLLDLLPLRQCFVARDRLPPKQLSDAIDRAMPMLRFFRLGDGSFARFNGCGATPTDALATVLAYDDIEGAPLRAAPHAGYARIESGATLLICDIGAAPATSLSTHAHAGCLSFEMSSGQYPIIVNCGAPSSDHDDWRPFARSTQAHSTLSFEDSSSADFVGTANGSDAPDDASLMGPHNVQGELSEDSEGLMIRGSHGGYASRYGVGHSRKIVVALNGLTVSGEDSLGAAKGLRGAALDSGSYAIRFHLHPCVGSQMSADGSSVDLVLPNREAWRIRSNAPSIELQDSFYLADERGPQQSAQVVLAGAMGNDREAHIIWIIEQIAAAGSGSLIDPNDPGDAA